MQTYGISDYTNPIQGKSRITSRVGPRKSRRTTNGARMSSFHHGTDIAGAKPGDKPPVRNITGGKVLFAGTAGGYGKTVVVRNPDGYIVQYAHLDSIDVSVGDEVPAGSNVGVMGGTGNVTGVHLDLIVVKDGKTLKPNGDVLANAPKSILKRGKGGSTSRTPKNTNPQKTTQQSTTSAPIATAPMFDVPTTPTQPMVNTTTPDLFADTNAMTTVLQGATGLAIPETPKQDSLFRGIKDMQLDAGLESIYAEAALAVAKASDGVTGRPMIQSISPLRGELDVLFDRLEV